MFNTIEEAISDLQQGKMLIVVDDESRENEGDLICPVDIIDAEKINFMAQNGRGLICCAIDKEIADKLNLKPMVSTNTDKLATNFYTSLDHKLTSTGISAADRALTITKMFENQANENNFNYPGHVFPLVAMKNGVLARQGHTEAAVDLAKLAGFQKPGGVICEIMNDDGTMARRDQLIKYAQKFDLKIITIKDLKLYRENLVPDVSINLPTTYGEFKLDNYLINQKDVLVLRKGEYQNNPLIRIHSKCLTGDVFGSQRCDCQEQLHLAMKRIEQEGGLIFYLDQEGRNIGLTDKLRAYELQEAGYDTVEANQILNHPIDNRDYEAVVGILKQHQIDQVRLMSNNPTKIKALSEAGIAVTRIEHEIKAGKYNQKYLKTKKTKMNHLIKMEEK